MLDALQRTPCLVSFSGGRDSSTVLAIATAVARRHGLPLPVPTTLRFPTASGSQESDWQERMVRHLDLPDWERIELTSELDVIGPVAQAGLRRHGPLWPPLAHFHVPIFERAVGGTVLTGAGGDEVVSQGAFGWLRGPRREWVRRANLRAVAVVLSPRPVRRALYAREPELRFPWLRPEVQVDVTRRRNDWRARSSNRWSVGIAQWWNSRYRTVQVATLAQLASDAGTEVVHPFLEPSVVAALARTFGPRGPADRSAAFRVLVGDLLPADVVVRSSKAYFTQAFISDYSRQFGASWTGGGVDETLVDPERLATELRSPRPNPRSSFLVQQAWLASVRLRPPTGRD